MLVKVGEVRIAFDARVKGIVDFSYRGEQNEIDKLKAKLAIAYGMYGMRLGNLDKGLAVDLLYALENDLNLAVERRKDISVYNPKVPSNTIP